MLEWIHAHAQEIFNVTVMFAMVAQCFLNFTQVKWMKNHAAWLRNHGDHLDLLSGWIKNNSKNISRIYGLLGGKKELVTEEVEQGENPCH